MIPIAQPVLGEHEYERVATVLEDGQLADGPEVRMFERAVADRCGAHHGVATANGTAALHAALIGLEVGPGDTVVTTPFTFIATANAATIVGADVAFVDIDPVTFTIDPQALESYLRAGHPADVVIPVHLYGLPADMRYLLELSDEFDFAVLEDAAQAHDAAFRGRPVGAIGDVGCFSFYPTKNATSGEGGMVVTNDESIADRVRAFVDHGRTEGYDHATVGHNFRLSSLHAAIGIVQLERLDQFTADRRRHARALTEQLEETDLTTPIEPPDRRHVYHQYTVRHPDRDRLQRELATCEVETAVYYPTPIHQQPPYRSIGGEFPEAERAASEVLSLPVHPALTEADIDHISQSVATTLGALA